MLYIFYLLSLVDVCQVYTVLENVDRDITHVTQSAAQCDRHLKPGWYRFLNVSGIRIPTTCPPVRRCSTMFPGWLNDAHPTVGEGIVWGRICFHKASDCCSNSIFIKVRNCRSFYVYLLAPTWTCPYRYCYISN